MLSPALLVVRHRPLCCHTSTAVITTTLLTQSPVQPSHLLLLTIQLFGSLLSCRVKGGQIPKPSPLPLTATLIILSLTLTVSLLKYPTASNLLILSLQILVHHISTLYPGPHHQWEPLCMTTPCTHFFAKTLSMHSNSDWNASRRWSAHLVISSLMLPVFIRIITNLCSSVSFCTPNNCIW